MVRLLILLSILIKSCGIEAQQIIEKYSQEIDSIRINEDEYLQHYEKGYTLILPADEGSQRGILVSLEDKRFNLEPQDRNGLIHPIALREGLAVVYISTGVPVDLFFQESSFDYVDNTLKMLFDEHGLRNENIFLFGTMVSGHRALKYVEYCENGKTRTNPDIRGVVLSESAIDWVRMWFEGQKQVRDSLNSTKYFEGNLITYLFRDNFSVTPEQDLKKYVDFSPYTYFDSANDKSKLYRKYAIRAYTFAPTNYWYSVNGNGVYDCNFPDMCGIINEQKLLGNDNAELIVYTNENREVVTEMERQSNTWNLVDKKELIDWIISKLEK